MGSSSPLQLLLPQVRISLLLFCCEGGPATPNQGVRCVAVHTPVRRLDHSESCTVITCCSSSCARRRPTASTALWSTPSPRPRTTRSTRARSSVEDTPPASCCSWCLCCGATRHPARAATVAHGCCRVRRPLHLRRAHSNLRLPIRLRGAAAFPSSGELLACCASALCPKRGTRQRLSTTSTASTACCTTRGLHQRLSTASTAATACCRGRSGTRQTPSPASASAPACCRGSSGPR